MVKKLMPLVPPGHHTYCDPFGGGGSLLLAKPPSAVEVYNDVDGGLVNFFRVLADTDDFERFYRRVATLPYSRALYEEYRDSWQDSADHVERAARWFVVARQAFSGCFGGSWSYVVTHSRRGMASGPSKWLSCLDGLPAVHRRLQRVQIESADFRQCLAAYDTPATFFYCDPPYHPDTRSSTRYNHDLVGADHRDLVELLLGLEGMALVSGYGHADYTALEEAGWERCEWQTTCHAAGRTRGTGIQGEGAALEKQPRTEVVWMNYEIQRRLF